jgi:hypothetical protein
MILPARPRPQTRRWLVTNQWLSTPPFAGKKNYFFGELELTIDWFATQSRKQLAVLKEKYIPHLHVVSDLDDHIHALLADGTFSEQFSVYVQEFELSVERHDRATTKLQSSALPLLGWNDAKAELLRAAYTLNDLFSSALSEFKQTLEVLSRHEIEAVRCTDFSTILGDIAERHEVYLQAKRELDLDQFEYKGREELRDSILREAAHIVSAPAQTAAQIIEHINGILTRLDSIRRADLQVFGDAGVGKTHLACNIADQRLRAGLPAILISGGHFVSDRPLNEQLLRILDIPSSYSWSDFLSALEAAAQAYRTRLPIVIDALNEAAPGTSATNLWRRGLPGLLAEFSTRPHLVLITTCRSTYQRAIWSDTQPENSVHCGGFEYEAIETAVRKYFHWYKIEADLTGAALLQFQHPIYLRIFCEATNPSREQERRIFIGEHALFEVFAQYLVRVNQAVCDRLQLHPSAAVVKPILTELARRLWARKTRSIPLDEFVLIADGEPLSTGSWINSKAKAILDEGLVINRDWSDGGETILFTYDLMAGYLIASIIIEDSRGDLASHLAQDEGVACLFGEAEEALHPLHDDTARALAALLPVENKQYLHDALDNPIAFTASIRALFEIPPTAITADAIRLITQLFGNSRNRRPLLELARSTATSIDHPLNALFWSAQLRSLCMADRDCSWGDYLLDHTEYYEKLVTDFEQACRTQASFSELADSRLRLLAEQTKWLLTTTVRPLRDRATRALYWYGRRFPEDFTNLVLRSLELNDPYVPERTLAALYGVAMARQHDFHDAGFREHILPMIALRLYESMFQPNAPHSTTHLLARDYARRTIAIALWYDPFALTNGQKTNATPLFQNGGIREWGESEDRDTEWYRDGNAPMQMDFANYTLGRLVAGRNNYDDEHPDYKRVRRNILWRIYNLGYSLERFGDTDKRIARANGYRRAADGAKTDRFGKKYCWIAFYELAGYRLDEGLIPEGLDDRISDADIDPSFPDELQPYNLVTADYLGDRTLPVEYWITNGDTPDVTRYFVVDELCDQTGPWILLDGYINQEDVECKRGCFVFLRSFIVPAAAADSVFTALKKQDMGGRWLPEVPEDYYVYAGEIPCGETYPPNDLSVLEFGQNRICGVNLLPAGDDLEKEQGRFEVLIPVRDNMWEAYHSTVNPGRNVATPAKQIARHLSLCGQPQTFDLFDTNGRRASISFCYGDKWRSTQRFTYLRQDLLDRYLQDTSSELILTVCGEREFHAADAGEAGAFGAQHVPYQAFQDVTRYSGIRRLNPRRNL